MSKETSAAALRKRTVARVIQAAGGKPPHELNADCQACRRTDLQLLVVTPSVIPKEHGAALKSAGHAWAPSFDPEFGSLHRDATIAVARLAGQGYVYVYYPQRELWDVWQVTNSGLTRQVIHQANVQQYSKLQSAFLVGGDSKQCGQGAANLPAHLVGIPGAGSVDKVWLAFSPRLWSPFVLKRFAANPLVDVFGSDGRPAGRKPLRELRGRELSPKNIVDGGPFGAGCLPLNAWSLKHNVADFVKEASADFAKAFELSLRPLDGRRFGQAEALSEKVRSIERASHPTKCVGKSLVIMLPDDLGVAEQHNHLRLCAKEAQQAWVAGAPDFKNENDDPLRSWKLRSSLHVEMIENWVFAEKLEKQKNLFEAGGYQGHFTIGEQEYQQMRTKEASTGKPYYPPGTTIVPKDGTVRTYRVTLPNTAVLEGLEGVAKESSASRIQRYHAKLRMAELQAFRDQFKAGIEGWEAYIAKLDEDHVRWLKTPRLATTLHYDFNTSIDLCKPQADAGAPRQQVEEAFDRIGAVEKAWGGGGIGPASVKELAKAYGKDPEAAAKWIGQALLEPWGLFSAIQDDPGKRKDVAEKVNAIAREMPELVKEALNGRRKMHDAPVLSLTQVHQQAAQLQAALLDEGRASKLGLAKNVLEDVTRSFTVHVRTAAVVNIMLNPSAERYATVVAKLPTDATLDRVGSVFRPPGLDSMLASKTSTTRQERRKSRNSFRRLVNHKSGALRLPEFQPLILTQATLDELTRQSVRHGEELVDVVAEGSLGELPRSFKLPRSTALELVSEQASFARASFKAVTSRQAGAVGLLGFFQLMALTTALGKLPEEDGYGYADTLMTVMGSTAGLLEGGLGLTAAVFEIKASGSKLVLGSRVIVGASLRVAAGIVGAASSGFDAVAAFAKYRYRKQRGERSASEAYLGSSLLFLGSLSSLLGGATLGFAYATVANFAISRLIVTRIGGAAAVELLGSSLTGIGIVLGLLGFAGTLYAESLEDDLNEIFLKRSYWGNGEGSQTKFAASEEPNSKEDAGALLWWAQRGTTPKRKDSQPCPLGSRHRSSGVSIHPPLSRLDWRREKLTKHEA